MGSPGKWIKGISPSSRVSDAAKRSLDARLDAVELLLPPAALRSDEDAEHVHRLRVATRRAVAAIDLYKNFLPRKKARILKRLLIRIRRAANAARDLDVLSEKIHEAIDDRKSVLLGDLSRQRAAAQPAIVDVYKAAIKEGRLKRKSSKLLTRIRPRRQRDKRPEFLTIGKWAECRVAHIAEKFFAAEPAESHDVAALHQFRVRGKALRYALELLASAIPTQLYSEVYPLVEELQDYLGAVNDHFTGAQRLQKWQQDATDSHEETFLANLAEQEHQRLEAARRAFWQWWQAGHRAQLQSAFFPPPLSSGPDSNDVFPQRPTAKAN